MDLLFGLWTRVGWGSGYGWVRVGSRIRVSSGAQIPQVKGQFLRGASGNATTWMKNIHDDLSLLDLGIHEARNLAQNRPVYRPPHL